MIYRILKRPVFTAEFNLRKKSKMTSEELLELLKQIQRMKCETQHLELKSAEHGCPKRLYDTLSSFSNQDAGGVIVFGVDEAADFREVGVYDPQDLQKQINNQCKQMCPLVRPVLTVAGKNGKLFVSAEIPGMDMADRPCYYQGKGRLTGAYLRVGDSDEPMTEYELYQYEAFRKHVQDDARIVENASLDMLDRDLVTRYLDRVKFEKPNLAALDNDQILRLMNMVRNGKPTLSALLLFSRYPQSCFPQLCVTGIVVDGNSLDDVVMQDERFVDNVRIEGNLQYMIEESMAFIRRNMRKSTVINENTGEREDRTEYPLRAVREAILNALLHRDYSVLTENKPVQIILYRDRLEFCSPGGLFGRISVDQLGKIQPDTRNAVLVSAAEILELTENRYSGIPAMRKALAAYGMPDPVFQDPRGTFVTAFYKAKTESEHYGNTKVQEQEDLLEFLRTPRTRREITEFLGLKSQAYAMRRYVAPLIQEGVVVMTDPETPKARGQRYYVK